MPVTGTVFPLAFRTWKSPLSDSIFCLNGFGSLSNLMKLRLAPVSRTVTKCLIDLGVTLVLVYTFQLRFTRIKMASGESSCLMRC